MPTEIQDRTCTPSLMRGIEQPHAGIGGADIGVDRLLQLRVRPQQACCAAICCTSHRPLSGSVCHVSSCQTAGMVGGHTVNTDPLLNVCVSAPVKMRRMAAVTAVIRCSIIARCQSDVHATCLTVALYPYCSWSSEQVQTRFSTRHSGNAADNAVGSLWMFYQVR